MTRQEYLCRQVENLVSNYIVPILNLNHVEQEKINRANTKGFLYQVGRLQPLSWLLELSRLLSQEELDEIIEKYEQEMENK